MATVGVYSFEVKVVSRNHHVYKVTSWSKARDREEVKVGLETSQSSKKVDPNACAMRAKEKYFNGQKTVGNIPIEISRHVYYFIKTDGDFVNGKVISTKFRPSPTS